ncbi:FtsW/RodA/SpoVE family cell cycle protein [Pseudoflavonifractor phocaeensis]|uniref:FtsW/RodA/SpoVE family cell cycle protein n=1 Tax=Pseudoflavonifractor phocaeensis TaxID=1870988 RepID=UPI00195ADF55|nr:FtsW/RodA/SpoVE family cell cycle protein [Pseudoflavonifractor phocaeensis]MBM6887653.1 FtsW/RodA/SpoVE family cell cycle protein [Pseudoflavonifractor phocaeensis]
MELLMNWIMEHQVACAWFTSIVRFVFPILALLILIRTIRSLLTVPCLPEVWAYLTLPNGAQEPLTHWENILGRGGNSDVILNYPVVSRQHAALIRNEDDTWTAYDLDSKGGVTVNGREIDGAAEVRYGDVLALGGVETVLLPLSPEEKAKRRENRRKSRPVSPWLGLVLLTIFQGLTAIQLTISEGEGATPIIPLTFLLLAGVMWLYFLVLRATGRVGFEMETIAFFLSTLSLAVTCSSNTGALFKQFLCVVLGLVLFLVLGIFLRDLDRTREIRWVMAGAAIVLLSLTVVLYAAGLTEAKYGAANWLSIGGVSVQPSEIAKICYIFAGAATLDRLFRKRNLGLFIVLTGVCLACLAYMSDFGTAAIFFITFLVIAYLRSGDWATLALICGGGVFAVLTILSVKPYILSRFATWGHAWQNASVGSGYQQTRTMSAAGDTDLVFGMLCEEWGLIIAVLAVLAILTLAVFAVRASRAGRSTFYIIAACAATSMMVFQTCLNVFGAVDILPLTGVTFPFVSNGGTAMIASWGLLAYLKATDTRQNASFAIRLPSRKEERGGARLAPRRTEEWEAEDEED